jgi:hypothetical protein
MRRRLVFIVAAAAVGMLFAALIVMPVFLGAGQFLYGGGSGASCVDTSRASSQPEEAADARAIPAEYLELYKKAGKDYGLPWNVLAGIGKVETNHGTSKLPGVSSGENYAGAGGPMQFLEDTFKAFAVDGDKDGKKNRYDPADAIPSAARYLKHNGAPERMKTALYMYNHSWDYVDLVLSWSKRYGGGDFEVVQADGPRCSDTDGLPENVERSSGASSTSQRHSAARGTSSGRTARTHGTAPACWRAPTSRSASPSRRPPGASGRSG